MDIKNIGFREGLEGVPGLLTKEETAVAEECMKAALRLGADKVQVSLSKNLMELYGTLNGELDKVNHCLDRSLTVSLFVEGRYGVFSTNRFDAVEDFIAKGVEMTRMLAKDPCRDLPDPSRTEKNAVTGNELGLFDPEYKNVTPDYRLNMALKCSVFKKYNGQTMRPAANDAAGSCAAAEVTDSLSEELPGKAAAASGDSSETVAAGPAFKLLSEEGEYSDNVYDAFVINSDGLRCFHSETSFDYGVEVTVQDAEGNRYSSYWWDSAPYRNGLHAEHIGDEAVRMAVAQIGPKQAESGKYSMVVDAEVSSKLLMPIFKALDGYSIQQNNSFMLDSLGKQVFPEWLTITDKPRTYGLNGSRLFDNEGVMTQERPIIDRGKVCLYFLNTFISNKLQTEPTAEAPVRPVVQPCLRPGMKWPGQEILGAETSEVEMSGKEGTGTDGLGREGQKAQRPQRMDRAAIMSMVRDGILVTGFNGGNISPATGNFSYGIEGFLFKDGKIVHPVREMLITGNIIELWNGLIAAGDDSRPCKSKVIPTLAFEKVDFSA